MLVLEGHAHADQPLMLTEFGGIALARQAGTWGYSFSQGAEDYARRLAALLATVRQLGLLAGFCYTQFSDTYQEANGLLHADRTPKIPLQQIADATSGAGRAPEHPDGLQQLSTSRSSHGDE